MLMVESQVITSNETVPVKILIRHQVNQFIYNLTGLIFRMRLKLKIIIHFYFNC